MELDSADTESPELTKQKSQIIGKKEQSSTTIYNPEKNKILYMNTTFVSTIPFFDESALFWLELLGKGGFGSVQKAYDKKRNEFIAVKSFNPPGDIYERRSQIEQIIIEDELLQKVEKIRTSKSEFNDYFLKFFGVFKMTEEPDRLILSMESGCCTLDDIIKGGKSYSCCELLHVVPRLVEGFVLLEENGIANRDVKPKNIILVENKNKDEISFLYRIADFGVGCCLSPGTSKVPIESLSGISVKYAAPEVFESWRKIAKKDETYDPFMADSFSLGLVILRMINQNWGKKILGKNLFKDPQILKDYNDIKEPLKGMLETNLKKRWSFKKVLEYFKKKEVEFGLKKVVPKDEHKFHEEYVIKSEDSSQNSIETLRGYFQNHKNLFQAYNNQVARPQKAKFHIDRAWVILGKLKGLLSVEPQLKDEKLDARERELSILNSYAEWYINMGNFKEAAKKLKTSVRKCKSMEEDELNIFDKIPGASEEDKVTPIKKHSGDSYKLMGNLSMKMGNFEKAEEIYQENLKIYQELHGEDHPEVAVSLNNLGYVYFYKGDNLKAEECFKRSLGIYQRKYEGRNHPTIATAMNNLGLVNKKKGDFFEAEDFYKKSLIMRQYLFGENHISVATSYNNLGELYESQDLTKSIDYYTESLKIRETILGRKHSDVADSLNNLGGIFLKMENWPKAEEYYSSSLEIYQGLFGEKNQLVATSYNNLGKTFKNDGKYFKADECYLKSLSINQSLFGENNLSVATAYNNLGNLYKAMGKLEKALEFYRKNLEIKVILSGKNDNSVANCYNIMAFLYRKKGDFVKAEENYIESLNIKKRIHGEKHAEVAVEFRNLGYVYQKQNDFLKAEEFYKKSLEINKGLFSENHHSVKICEVYLEELSKKKAEFEKTLTRPIFYSDFN